MILQLGPAPVPPPPELRHVALEWMHGAIPFLVVGGAVLSMLLSVALRYNQRFREWWEHNVCGWMEEHAVKSDETKGGM